MQVSYGVTPKVTLQVEGSTVVELSNITLIMRELPIGSGVGKLVSKPPPTVKDPCGGTNFTPVAVAVVVLLPCNCNLAGTSELHTAATKKRDSLDGKVTVPLTLGPAEKLSKRTVSNCWAFETAAIENVSANTTARKNHTLDLDISTPP